MGSIVLVIFVQFLARVFQIEVIAIVNGAAAPRLVGFGIRSCGLV
jgi:hypothetical protein